MKWWLCLLLGMYSVVHADVVIHVNESLRSSIPTELENARYAVSESSITFSQSDYEWFSGGVISASPLFFEAVAGTQNLRMHDARTGLSYLLKHPHKGVNGDTLHILNTDVYLTGESAELLGMPDMAGIIVAEAHISIPFTAPPTLCGDPELCTTNFGPSIDLLLIAITNVQQVAREPGRVAISMLTRLVNAGEDDIPWYWSINPPGPVMPVVGQHPYAIFNLYRKLDGAFRQIGKSDVKHAFFSANTACDCPSAQVIFPGCQDAYGVMNNANQFYFGPRHEVHVHSGNWQSLGSHFDVTAQEPDPNDFRSHTNETSAFTHRLVIAEPFFNNTNAEYFVENWYPVKDDVNPFNNMGYRRITPRWTNNMWLFTLNSPLVNGPAINTFIPPDHESTHQMHKVIDTGEGHLQLAANVIEIAPSEYRYNYSLMNLDFDRNITAFEVPVSSGVTISQPFFGDPDMDPTNNWHFTFADGKAAWNSGGSNTLEWGSMLLFSFVANAPPTPALAAMKPWMAGNPDKLELQTLTPGSSINEVAVSHNVQIHLSSFTGVVYDVEYTSTLHPADWIGLGLNITASGPNVIITDTNTPTNHLFYRLKQH